MQIAGLNTPQQRQAFLDTHWQKSHCFFPAAFERFKDPLNADDLAALAMETALESRIVEGDQLKASHGPFTSERLENFPESNATLLVQSVDQFDPDVAKLLAAFNFIPNWRRDDVMVSFSTPGGGVGPHFDQYDVFLVQGQGQRRWRIGQHCETVDDTDLDNSNGHQLLRDFQPLADYLCSPGDVLYIPPGVAHWGSSVSNSLTYSIGFRAPSIAELADTWLEQIALSSLAQQRYQDDGSLPLLSDGIASERISSASIARLQTLLRALANDRDSIASALGILQTERRCIESELHSADAEPEPEQEYTLPWPALAQKIENGPGFSKNPKSRICYYRNSSSCLLFIDGNKWELGNCSTDWLEMLCSKTQLRSEEVLIMCGSSMDKDQTIHNRELLMLVLRQGVWATTEDMR